MQVAHPPSGFSSTWFLVELEFGNVVIRGVVIDSESWSALIGTVEFLIFSLEKLKITKENHSSRWIKHPILVSQIILIKNHSSRLLPKSLFMRNRNQSDYTDNSLGIKQALHDSRKYTLPPSYNPKAMQISLAPINIAVCSVVRIQLISSRSA